MAFVFQFVAFVKPSLPFGDESYWIMVSDFFFKTVRIFYIPETTVRVLGALHHSLHSGLSNMELMTDRILGGMV